MICIYRHRKLYVVMPSNGRWKKPQHYDGMEFNFAPIIGDVCNVVVQLPRLVDEEYQKIKVSMDVKQFGKPTARKLHWAISKDGSVEVTGSGIYNQVYPPGAKSYGKLVNLAWSMMYPANDIYEMMDKLSSRSIIELLLHKNRCKAEDYDIVQMYFDVDTEKFYTNIFPMRQLKEAEEQALLDDSECAQKWLDLFEKA